MKALSTAWQSRLQSSAFTNLSEAGQLFSFPAALTLPFGKCPFAISAFCPPGLAGFAIKTRLRKLELFSINTACLGPSVFPQKKPQARACLLYFPLWLSWPCSAAQRGTGPREQPGLSPPRAAPGLGAWLCGACWVTLACTRQAGPCKHKETKVGVSSPPVVLAEQKLPWFWCFPAGDGCREPALHWGCFV